MIYILWGKDTFSRDEALAEIEAGLGGEELLSPNTTRLQGKEVTVEGLLSICQTIPFLAPHRLVIIEGFLATFEARPKGKGASTTPEASMSILVAGLAAIPPSTVLIFLEEELSPTNPLLQSLTPLAQVQQFSPPRGDGLVNWIRRRVEAQGEHIAPSTARLLAETAGDDLRLLAQEVEKLLLYAAGQPITEETLKLLVPQTRQESVFALVDAIAQGEGDGAQQRLWRLQAEGAAAPYLLVMIARQFRLLLRIKALSQEGEAPPAIRHRLGLSQFVFGKSWAQARRYSWDRLVAVQRRLLQADLAIKTGREAGALELLIADLCPSEGKRPEARGKRGSYV